MAEEHGFQAPEGHRLCANNCGFFGSPATSNLCAKCYRDLRMKEEQNARAIPTSPASPSTPSSAPLTSSSSSTSSASSVVAPAVEQADLPAPAVSASAVVQSSRCLECRKRVGLTGFKCRCGSTFCGSHRYPEQHGCTFDYKTMGKEAIAKANPVVKAAKLNKI